MKFVFKWLFSLAILVVGIALGYRPALEYWKQRNLVQWETAEVEEGDVTRFVNSTGSVKPVQSVSVGSFVSGPIVELNVDFNDEVKRGDCLAKVDPRLFEAALKRDQATLATQKAGLERIDAELQQARNNLERGQRLRKKSESFLSDNELDALIFQVKSLEAQRKLAEASILQAEASLETAEANLNYCEILAPVDGLIIDRKIDPGQTLAAQFQTPELFIVAPDLREKVHVFASVDEADIGLIQKARKESRPVTFTVDAHPGDVFEGTIEQIRMSSVTNNNVVTYPVVVAATNPELKLLPGMTASISFEVDSTFDVPKIPNTALRFYPEDVKLVREQDRKLVDGSSWKEKKIKEKDDREELSAVEKAKAKRNRNKRHVWVVDGDKLKAIEVETGLSEAGYTELKSGELKTGDKLVTGKKAKKA